ncbi:MAG: hypothetical protein LBB20_01795 [Puniceicoccales bacterium]|nr:hypothetical protein [Puniceicoccales bacterium]
METNSISLATTIDGQVGIDRVIGSYQGQEVKLHEKTLSAIELADRMDDFVAAKIRPRTSIKDRKIETKKKIKEKEKILSKVINRLGGFQNADKYKNFESTVRRMMNRSLLEEDAKKSEGPIHDIILKQAANDFGEVTEQDNVIQYAFEAEELEQFSAESELRQVEKMQKRLEGRTDSFAVQKKQELGEQVNSIKASINSSKLFQEELNIAQAKLNKHHGKEIKDGYNIIPKAAELLKEQQLNGQDNELSPTALAADYRDEVLKMDNPLDLFENFYKKHEGRKENFDRYIDSMIELLGRDMESANPSRSMEELRAVRDGLFRIEISGQAHNDIGMLAENIKKTFPLFGDKKFTIDEQLVATRELVKMTQSTFVSDTQVLKFIEIFGPTPENDLEATIYAMNRVTELVRKFPMKFFNDPQSRNQLLDTAQHKLDELILLEEEANDVDFFEESTQ